MATAKTKSKRKPSTREAYFIRVGDVEIGPFRSRAAALAEARAIRDDGEDVTLRKESMLASRFQLTKAGDEADEGGDDDLDLDALFNDDEADDDEADDDEADDDDLIDLNDDDDETDDDDDDDQDDPPKVTHPFFRRLGKDDE